MNMKRLTKISILFALALLPLQIFSQSVSIRVANRVIQGHRFTVSITVTNGEANVTRDMAPKLSGCTLLSGPGVSTMQSVQIINGHQTASVSRDYTFTYSADKAGTVNIPAIKVRVDGKEMSTQPKTVTILPPDQAQQPSPYGGYPSDIDELEEWLNQMMGIGSRPAQRQPQQPAAADDKISSKDFLVTVSLSKSDLYEKEAVIATIKLYTKHDVTKFQPVVMPQFEGFLSEEIDVSNLEPQIEHYRGENYYSVVLKKCLLYPQKSGKLRINSGTYDVTLRTAQYVTNGYYSTPVYNTHNITTTSNSVTVDVKALPTPIPPSFNGAVGDFDITTTLVPEKLRTNEAAKYTLAIKGVGNLKHLAEPIVPFPKTVEEYTPTSETDVHFNGSNMQGTYTALYTFVPQQEGELTIPSWNFTYFNPSTGKYVTVALPEYTRAVGKGIGTPAAGSAPSSIDTGGIRDIRHIAHVKESDLSMTPDFIFFKFWYWLVYILAVVALGTSLIVYRRRIKMKADVQGQRIRKARSVASKRLTKARAAMGRHNGDEFYAAVSSALWGFLSDKLKIAASSLTRENISGKLLEAGTDPALVDRCIKLLDECEMARFTPSHTDTEMSEIYEEANNVINGLNRLRARTDRPRDIKTTNRYGEPNQ